MRHPARPKTEPYEKMAAEEIARKEALRIEDERFNRRLKALDDQYELAVRRLDAITKLNEEHYQRKAALVGEMADGRGPAAPRTVDPGKTAGKRRKGRSK